MIEIQLSCMDVYVSSSDNHLDQVLYDKVALHNIVGNL
jgi:hypothetical protein